MIFSFLQMAGKIQICIQKSCETVKISVQVEKCQKTYLWESTLKLKRKLPLLFSEVYQYLSIV